MNAALFDHVDETLASLPFIEWDRFTVGDWEGQPFATVYGWIDREDEYKDFVLVIRWADGATYFTTSSADRTHEIHRALFPDDDPEDHNDCRRVEDHFDVENAVRLHEQAKLGEAAQT